MFILGKRSKSYSLASKLRSRNQMQVDEIELCCDGIGSWSLDIGYIG